MNVKRILTGWVVMLGLCSLACAGTNNARPTQYKLTPIPILDGYSWDMTREEFQATGPEGRAVELEGAAAVPYKLGTYEGLLVGEYDRHGQLYRVMFIRGTEDEFDALEVYQAFERTLMDKYGARDSHEYKRVVSAYAGAEPDDELRRHIRLGMDFYSVWTPAYWPDGEPRWSVVITIGRDERNILAQERAFGLGYVHGERSRAHERYLEATAPTIDGI